MKWLTLKIYLYPVIMQEVDTVNEIYINLINEIRRTNDEDKFNEFQQLRESIVQRIEELEQFFEANMYDSRVVNFEKVIERLQKIISYDPENKTEMDNNNYHPNDDQAYSPEKKQYEKISNNNNNNIKPIPKNEKVDKIIQNYPTPQKYITSKTNIKPIKPQQPQSKVIQKKEKVITSVNSAPYSLHQNVGNLIMGKEKKAEKNTKAVEGIPSGRGSGDLFSCMPNSVSENFKEMNKWKEIVFKIKLTEGEYKLLLKEKSKGVINI